MIYFLRALTAFLLGHGTETEATHEIAHRACEIGVYAFVAPNTADDSTTTTGEAVAEALCRSESL